MPYKAKVGKPKATVGMRVGWKTGSQLIWLKNKRSGEHCHDREPLLELSVSRALARFI